MRLALLLIIAGAGCAATPKSASPTGAPEPVEAAPAGALDPLLTTYEYAYPVHFFEAKTQQQMLRMAYVDVAPSAATGAKPRTIVLLHGKNFSAGYWAKTIELLSGAGFRVIAPDQIGFGKSAKPERYQFSFEALADTTRQLIDSLGIDKVTVVGHSMGGMLALRFARMYATRVDRMVLVNPIGLEDWRAKGVPSATLDELLATELAQAADKIRGYQRETYFAGAWKPEYEPLVEVLIGWTKHPRYREVAWNAALTADMIFTQPVIHELPSIATPTLLLVGDRDRTAIGKNRASKELAATLGDYGALAKAAAAALPKATLVLIPNVGHVPQIEAWPEYSKALLAFVVAN